MSNSIVFDMDGILFDTERLYKDAWLTVGTGMGLSDSQEVSEHCVGLSYADTKKYILERYGQDFPFDRFINGVSGCVQAQIDRDGVPVKDGVYDILAYLRKSKYKIGLATSSSMHSAKGHLIQSGLSDYFYIIVTSDMVAKGKPAPDIYLAACSMLGAAPRDTYAVEDSPNGIKSAHNAGLRTIMVPDLFEPTAELDDMLYAKFDTLLGLKSYLESNN